MRLDKEQASLRELVREMQSKVSLVDLVRSNTDELKSRYDRLAADLAAARGDAGALPSWDAFMEAYKDRLDRHIASALAKHRPSSPLSGGTDQQSVTQAVGEAVERVQADVTGRIAKLRSELNRNLTASDEESRRLFMAAINDIRPKASAPVAQPSSAPLPDISLKPEERAVIELVRSEVGTALLRYAKDALGWPDYALFSGGARIVPKLTEATRVMRPPGVLNAWLAKNARQNAPARGPAMALEPTLTPGACWPFNGPQAQLGIALSRRVVVSNVTLEHVSRDVAIGRNVGSAPTDFELWAEVADPAHMARLAAHRSGRRQQRGTIREKPSTLLLAEGTYRIDQPDFRQTFPVLDEAAELAIPVDIVVLRILGLHGGNEGPGCLYRVRVGGVESE